MTQSDLYELIETMFPIEVTQLKKKYDLFSK